MSSKTNLYGEKRRFQLITFLGLLFSIVVIVFAMLIYVGVFNYGILSDELDENMTTYGLEDRMIVLIMGVDKRENDVGRADTLMVAAIDPYANQIALLSIPRDTRVRIRGHGYDKINASYAYGGVRLVKSTVENFLGIDVDYYVLVDVDGLVKVIDAIGGVDINVPERMFYEDIWDDNGGLRINLYPGFQHMDGKTAMTYVRYRDSEGDIGRVKRQQEFMSVCMDKITSPQIILRIPRILRESTRAIETNISLRQFLEIAEALKAAQENGIAMDIVPGYPLYIDEISYWIPNTKQLKTSVASALGIYSDSLTKKRFY